MTIVSGDSQAVPPGSELPEPLVVRVNDANGQPVQGQAVVFRVSSGGGRVFAGIAVTNAQGIARERWTVGATAADSQRVQALGIDNATGEARIFATFRAILLPGPPANMIVYSGNHQTVMASGRTELLQVRVTDRYGNPSKGVEVTFTSDRGGTFWYYNPSTTGRRGLAGIYFDPRFGGDTRVTATVPGLSPVSFTVRSRYGVALLRQTPAQMTLAVGQTGQVTATAYDSAGAPIPDAPMLYYSDPASVASVDNLGKITAKAAGSTYIIARSERGVGGPDTTWVTVTSATASVGAAPRTLAAGKPASRAWSLFPQRAPRPAGGR